MLKIATATHEDSVLTLDFLPRSNAVVERRRRLLFSTEKRTVDEDKDQTPETLQTRSSERFRTR